MCLQEVRISSGTQKAVGSPLLPVADKPESSVLFVVSSCGSITGGSGHGGAVVKVSGLPITAIGTSRKASDRHTQMNANPQAQKDYRTTLPEQER